MRLKSGPATSLEYVDQFCAPLPNHDLPKSLVYAANPRTQKETGTSQRYGKKPRKSMVDKEESHGYHEPCSK
ncbi:uncharacterized protein P884DRAFT_68717 [Thermothelomyces heterothallicus CBS 202.75]|uniref:uncharacterized protein n=1 Tax=Thermothelomyces heterothallicus CBS 202.75 TaxID=1149848 RepID=UPI0037430BC3